MAGNGNFYQINSKLVYGGPGRLIVAPYGTARPTKISDIMNLSDYSLQPGWRDLGSTSDGISPKRGFKTNDMTVDQSLQPVDQSMDTWNNSLSTKLAENSVENRQLALIGSIIESVAPTLGAATTLSADVVAGATVLTLTAVDGFSVNTYVQVGDEIKKIALIDAVNKKITLSSPLTEAHATTDSIAPVTELGYKKISYGAPSEVPTFLMALLSQKKDGSIYCAVWYKCKVSGDDAEQNFDNKERTIPLSVNCYTEDDLPEDSNMMIEFDQQIA